MSQSYNIQGSNPGAWGFGKKGSFYPSSFNGPFGSVNNPLPINLEYPVLLNTPKYSSYNYNGPYYNESLIEKILKHK